MPASSPTLVDPDYYPYPPTPGVTPGVLSVDPNSHSLSAFASPMWSTRTSSSGAGGLSAGAALPPRSPPPGISLPPRLPPGLSNGGQGTPGFLDGSGAGPGGSAGGAGQGPGFLLGRQFGPDSSSVRVGYGTDGIGNGAGGGSVGRELSGLQQQQLREAAFDAAFGSGQLSSGNLGGVAMTDEELGSLSHLGGRMVGVVGSPPPSSPPPGGGMRAQAMVLSRLFSNKGSGSTSCISSNNDNENNNSNSNSNETGDAGGDGNEF